MTMHTEQHPKGNRRPMIAIIDSNTLAVMGLKQLLQTVMPIMTIDAFSSFDALSNASPEQYVHYFVAMDIVVSHRAFFLEHRRKTIVLTVSKSDASQLTDFHSVNVNQSEDLLVRDLLHLQQYAHHDGRHLPPMPSILQRKMLSDREIEVTALIAQGLINKEIADRLNISLSTVITHRKNIMDKLGLRSVSALTIYAVMHGFVDINKI
jgi:DNA-binding NarL/FixJ family response regulator